MFWALSFWVLFNHGHLGISLAIFEAISVNLPSEVLTNHFDTCGGAQSGFAGVVRLWDAKFTELPRSFLFRTAPTGRFVLALQEATYAS